MVHRQAVGPPRRAVPTTVAPRRRRRDERGGRRHHPKLRRRPAAHCHPSGHRPESGRLGYTAGIAAGVIRCGFDRWRRLRRVGKQLRRIVGHRLVRIDDRVRLREWRAHAKSEPAQPMADPVRDSDHAAAVSRCDLTRPVPLPPAQSTSAPPGAAASGAQQADAGTRHINVSVAKPPAAAADIRACGCCRRARYRGGVRTRAPRPASGQADRGVGPTLPADDEWGVVASPQSSDSAHCHEGLGPLAVLVNCASIARRMPATGELDEVVIAGWRADAPPSLVRASVSWNR